MAMRLVDGGIQSPLQLRHTSPERLRKVCKSVVGEHWHYRLNFREVDIATDDYKSMQAMRQISKYGIRFVDSTLRRIYFKTENDEYFKENRCLCVGRKN